MGWWSCDTQSMDAGALVVLLLLPLCLSLLPSVVASSGRSVPATGEVDWEGLGLEGAERAAGDDMDDVRWLLQQIHAHGLLVTREYQVPIRCSLSSDRLGLESRLRLFVAQATSNRIVLPPPIVAIVRGSYLDTQDGLLQTARDPCQLRHRYYDVDTSPNGEGSFGTVDLKLPNFDPLEEEDWLAPSWAVNDRAVEKLEDDIYKCYTEISRATKVYGEKHPPGNLARLYYLFPGASQVLSFAPAATPLVEVDTFFEWACSYWGDLSGWSYKVEFRFSYGSDEEAARSGHDAKKCVAGEWSIRLFGNGVSQEPPPPPPPPEASMDVWGLANYSQPVGRRVEGKQAPQGARVRRDGRVSVRSFVHREAELVISELYDELIDSSFAQDEPCAWPVWVWFFSSIIALFAVVIALALVLLYRVSKNFQRPETLPGQLAANEVANEEAFRRSMEEWRAGRALSIGHE